LILLDALINSAKNTVKNNPVLPKIAYFYHHLAPCSLFARLLNALTSKPLKKRLAGARILTCATNTGKHQLVYTLLFISASPLFFSSTSYALESNCSSFAFNKRSVVTRVYDGDTVKLASGEKIRLVGINTPEMHYDTGTPEPYAKKAKRFLEKRVLKKRVGIKFAKEKKDRYKRQLGHLFLLDGTNIQYEILQAGLAFNVTFPPNLWQSTCYKQAENQARRKQLNIWKSPYYKPINASKINKSKLGFRRVSGTVKSILPSKKNLILRLSDKMTLRISKKDLHYFRNLPINKLTGKQVTASGWLSFYKNRFSMKIKHPNALEMQ